MLPFSYSVRTGSPVDSLNGAVWPVRTFGRQLCAWPRLGAGACRRMAASLSVPCAQACVMGLTR